MGDLIVMPRPKTLARTSAAGESAAILFFTGVRYLRLDDAVAVSPSKIGRRRRAARAKKPSDAALVG